MTDEAKMRRFFKRHLVRAAQELRERGVRFFALGPEKEAESWYVDGPFGEAEFVRIEKADLEIAMRDMWKAQDLPELAELVTSLMKLARTLEPYEDDSEEVSPFIYVMY